MEVTRKNFKETLPVIKESINKADFLSIDAEFTGLSNGRDVSIFDTPEDYYKNTLNGSNEFLLIQFGLCAFYWDEEKQHYMNDAYNFYLFPRGRPGPEKIFMCQSSSLDFLAANGFDFNKLIKEGISYMTEPTETKLRENLLERQQSYSKEKEPIRIPDENKQYINDVCQQVKTFIDEKKSDEMEIDRCNSFIRLLLFQELRTRFKDEIYVDTKILENKNRILKVTRRKSDDEDPEKLRKQREWDELDEAVGFSKVAQMISQSEKLVVGHNMLLDVMHTLNHFFQPLPSDYQSFKEFAHCMFPKLIDTKYMSSLPPFKDKIMSNVLKELLICLSEPPFSLPKVGCVEGRGYRHEDAKEHEAGYDAYVTGLCYVAMSAHVCRASRVTQAGAKPYLNKLFLARTARQDSPYINLSGKDPSPSRDHVFHLTFPKEWQRNDLNQLFSPFGGVTVQFLDDTSAYVGLERREQAAGAARALAHNARVTLTPYARHRARHYKSLKETTTVETPPASNPYKLILTPETKKREAVKSNITSLSSPVTTSVLPEKVARSRSNSMSVVTPPQTHSRKRTSSGVFQVDESEPLPKKAETTRLATENSRKQPEAVTNNRRKNSETEQSSKDKEKSKGKGDIKETKKNRVIERFDKDAKSNCVSAFKESDSWD